MKQAEKNVTEPIYNMKTLYTDDEDEDQTSQNYM